MNRLEVIVSRLVFVAPIVLLVCAIFVFGMPNLFRDHYHVDYLFNRWVLIAVYFAATAVGVVGGFGLSMRARGGRWLAVALVTLALAAALYFFGSLWVGGGVRI